MSELKFPPHCPQHLAYPILATLPTTVLFGATPVPQTSASAIRLAMQSPTQEGAPFHSIPNISTTLRVSSAHTQPNEKVFPRSSARMPQEAVGTGGRGEDEAVGRSSGMPHFQRVRRPWHRRTRQRGSARHWTRALLKREKQRFGHGRALPAVINMTRTENRTREDLEHMASV